MLFTIVKGIEYPSTRYFIFLDKATRLIAGPAYCQGDMACFSD